MLLILTHIGQVELGEPGEAVAADQCCQGRLELLSQCGVILPQAFKSSLRLSDAGRKLLRVAR